MNTRAMATALIAILVGLAGTTGAVAQTESDPIEVDGSFVDTDGNGLDDGLDSAVAEAAPQDRFDVIVAMNNGAEEADIRRAAGGFDTYARFSVVSGFAATMTAAQIRGLARTPGIFRIEPDSVVSTTVDSATAEFGTDAARSTYGVDGSGVTICIPDTGIDPNHEQLDGGKVVGFIDYVGGLTDAYDDQGHGTHVASIAAGDGVGASSDAALFAGVAPGASILSAKVLDSAGGGAESNIILALEWCVAQGADVISMSLGTGEGADGADSMSRAVDEIVAAGVPVVVAAGNSGDGAFTTLAPGNAASAITVGAVAESVAPVGTPRHSNGIHLAGFSSRGPTGAGLMKPDIVAPGVTITAAKANAPAGYVTFSGTSMATPFVAGTLALALEANPSLSAAQLKSLVTTTAQDRGVPGADDNWGAGLLDGFAIVSQAAGASYVPTRFPANDNGTGSVGTGGVWSHEFALDADALASPIGITVLIDGQAECPIFCFSPEWNPDLEARLFDPVGNLIAESTCPFDLDDDHCGSLFVTQGQQETLAVMPTVAGTYRMEVWPVSGGGSFTYDISTGADPVGPPANLAPVADAGPDQNVPNPAGTASVVVSLDGSGSSDPDGIIQSYQWSIAGSSIASGPTPSVSLGVGTHTITLVVTDDDGASASDSVVIDVAPPPPPNVAPVADAGPDQAVADTRKKGSEEVALDGSGSSDSDGSIQSYVWSIGGTTIASGVRPNVTLDAGIHDITLRVTDDAGDSSTDTVLIAVGVALPANAPPIADAGADQSVPTAFLELSASVTLDGSGSTDDNGITSYTWTENGTQIATGVTATLDFDLGTHVVTLQVRDAAGLTSTDDVVITVFDPNGPLLSHVHDLDGSAAPSGRNKWTATVDVFVVGTELESVGLVVGVDPSTVTFSLSTGGTLSCTTTDEFGNDGKCSVTTPPLAKGTKSITLTVVSVSTPGFVYDPADNHDVDSDSTGTSITIVQP